MILTQVTVDVQADVAADMTGKGNSQAAQLVRTHLVLFVKYCFCTDIPLSPSLTDRCSCMTV